MTEEPLDSLILKSTRMIASKLTWLTVRSPVCSSSRTMLPSISLEETTLAELVLCNLLRSIQVHSTLPMSRILMATPSPPELEMLWSSVMVRIQPSPFQRARVSNFPTLRREMPDLMTRNRMLMKMTHEYNEKDLHLTMSNYTT